MGLMDAFKSLTQPMEEEDDFFEDANDQFRPAAPSQASEASAFENTFGAATPAAAPAQKKASLFSGFNRQQAAPAPANQSFSEEDDEGSQYDEPAPSGGLFGNLGARRQAKAAQRANVGFAGGDPQVTVFQPRNFEDIKKLVLYLKQGRSVFMNMEGVPVDTARRLLDACSGVALALDSKVTPMSGKTYFVTPIGVDIINPAQDQDDVRIY